MLEIIILIALCKRLGTIVREKGYRAGGYQFMLVAFWFGGEIAGAIFGVVLAHATHPELEEAPLGMVYIPALLGAVLGAVTAFIIAKSLHPVQPAPTGYGEHDYDRGGREGERWADRPSAPGEPYITERPAPPPPRQDDRIRE